MVEQSTPSKTKTAQDALIDQIAQDVIEACPIDGLMIKQNTIRGDPVYTHAPMALFPTPYPLDIYSQAYHLQKPMGDLVGGIVADPVRNIHELLDDFATKDAFMVRLISVSKAFQEQRQRGEPTQDIHCMILRSDYMIDQPTHSIKLVEYNTIASSFGCLSQKVREMHRYVLAKYGSDLALNYGLEANSGVADEYRKYLHADKEVGSTDIRINQEGYSYIDRLVETFAQAITHYKESKQRDEKNPNVWVLFVCEDDERNVCDQKVIEVNLARKHGIQSMRKTFDEIQKESSFDESTKKLIVAGKEIGFVYYRTGYQADHYMVAGSQEWDETKWQTRTMLECSLAVKCPSIDLHLATFKKFQQSFSDEALLRKVSGSDATTEALKQLFKGIWSLEDLGKEGAEVNEVVERALLNPHEFVLKPQKEGGGHNFFDQDLKENLISAKAGGDQQLQTYLIMERINPPMIPALMLRNGEVTKQNSLSEFGFYSSLFTKNTSLPGQESTSNSRETLGNDIMGTLMRTKASHHNEGGVNSGFSVIDTPFVVPVSAFTAADGEQVKGTLQF